MKVRDIAAKSDKELAGFVTDAEAKLRTVIIESRTKESKNVKLILAARKDLARALTITRQRQLGQEEKQNV